MPWSMTTPGRPGACESVPVRVAFRCGYGVGTQDDIPIAAQWLAYAYACQRFAPHLAMCGVWGLTEQKVQITPKAIRKLVIGVDLV